MMAAIIPQENAIASAEIDLRDYLAFAHRIAQRHAHFLGGDLAEAFSAVLFAMSQAKQTWQPGAGANFASYLLIIARREIFRAASRRQRENGVARRHRFNAGPAANQPQQAYSFALVSIDAPIAAGSDDTLGATIPDGDMLDPEAALAAKQDAAAAAQKIDAAMSVLSERERRVIMACRLADEPMTLKAVGAELGIGRERARQIEAKALDKLKLALTGQPQRPGFVARPQLPYPPTADELARLDPRERRVAEGRLFPDARITLRTLADEFGVAESSISFVEARTYKKILAWRGASDPAATPEPVGAAC